MKRAIFLAVMLMALNPLSGFSQPGIKEMDKGNEYFEAGKFEEALVQFLKYAKKAPNDYYPYNRLGWVYNRLQRHQEAIANFNKSNNLMENFGNYMGLGECYSALGEYETALRYNLKYAKLNPENSDPWFPHNALGWNYYNLQMYFDAMEEFQKAIAFHPAANSYLGLCNVYLDIGQYEKARDILLKLMQRPKEQINEDQLRMMLGYCNVSQGRLEEAYKVFGNRSTVGLVIKKAENGIKITAVRKNGPADLAGFKPGDVMVEWNGIPLHGVKIEEFSPQIVGLQEFGSKVKVKIYRDAYYDDLYIYVGISPAIHDQAMNDPDCIKQRKAAGTGGNGSKINIAVSNLNAHGVPEDDAVALSSRLRSILFATYEYNVLEREKMKDILGEQMLQQTGATTDENLVQAGKLLNVKYIIGGSISKIGESFSVSLRMINVETGTIASVAFEDVRGTMEDVYTAGLRNAAYRLIR